MPAISTRRGRATRLILHQIKYDFIALTRSHQALFFTIAMPVGFLLLFSSMFGQAATAIAGYKFDLSTYYIANLVTFAIIDVAFMNLAITIVESRESGILRRREATPQSSLVIIVARSASAISTALVSAALVLLVGHFAYHTYVSIDMLPVLVLTIVVGCIACCSLAFALSSIVRTSSAAQPVAMAFGLPLFFISGIFIPWPFIPQWLQHIALVFPLRHLSLALFTAFLRSHRGDGLVGILQNLGIIALWGVAGLAISVRIFRWAPRTN